MKRPGFCEQARWARSAKNSAIDNLCNIFIISNPLLMWQPVDFSARIIHSGRHPPGSFLTGDHSGDSESQKPAVAPEFEERPRRQSRRRFC